MGPTRKIMVVVLLFSGLSSTMLLYWYVMTLRYGGQQTGAVYLGSLASLQCWIRSFDLPNACSKTCSSTFNLFSGNHQEGGLRFSDFFDIE